MRENCGEKFSRSMKKIWVVILVKLKKVLEELLEIQGKYDENVEENSK